MVEMSLYKNVLEDGRKIPHLLVIDGNYVMQRSFHVFEKRDLREPGGLPSGIVYGFIKSFQKLMVEFRPNYCIVVFDRGRSKYRLSISPDYKSNRSKSPDDVRWQFKTCRDFLKLSGWTPYVETGVEGDDLAARIARDCSEENLVMLYSVDHDWKQLLGDNVIMIRPKQDHNEIVDYAKASEELGEIGAERWPEIAAIMGDPGDGVIGIKGYGPMKARRLIEKYGDLWTAINSEPVLIENADRIEKNYDLTKLDGSVPSTPVPLEQNLCRSAMPKIYTRNVRDFFIEWGMNEFIEELDDGTFWK